MTDYQDYKSRVRDIPNFPVAGLRYKDMTRLLMQGDTFVDIINGLAEPLRALHADVVVGPEASGFIIGAPLAYALNAGFIPARQPSKLPRECVRVSYEMDYGMNQLEMQRDSIQPGQRVIICDDLLATGGTSRALIELIHKLGGEVVACAYVIELLDLPGRQIIDTPNTISLIQF